MTNRSKKILVPGQSVPSKYLNLNVAEARGRIEVSLTRDSDSISTELKNEDVVSLTYENGFHRFIRVDELEKEGFISATRSSEEGLSLETVLSGGETRGSGLALKVVEFFRPKLKKDVAAALGQKAAGLTATAICKGIEKKYVPQQGLFKIDVTRLEEAWIAPDAKPLKAPFECPEQPVLLMLHGTASSTDGSFVGLSHGVHYDRWSELLKDKYAGRVWAFNHHTLTVSPLDNAIELLEVLPVGVELHLLSHSRGGLLGELISLDPHNFYRSDTELFSGKEAKAFQRLVELLKEKRPKITRFVRVACPALGTTLASERLDRYLTGLFNVLEFFVNSGKYIALGQGAAPLYFAGDALEKILGMLRECLVTLVSQKAKVEVLPGLAAMLPDSPVIRLLNYAERRTDADLTVIAGDVKSVGDEKRRFANLAGDLFYLEEHDWIVNTRAMYGGIHRRKPVAYLSQGASSNHLRYFVNSDTFEALCEALSGNLKRFKPIERETLEEPNWWKKLKFVASRDGEEDTRPIVFLLPGIMGSHLYADGVPVWLSPEAIAKGEFVKRLAFRAENEVDAPGVMYRHYGELAEFLNRTHCVEVFPYDWRQPVEKLGQDLADRVKKLAEETGNRKIRFLCHSMGGLVVRSMMTRKKFWSTIKSRVDRIVMLGVPNRGSYKTLQILLGQGGIFNPVNLLAAGDFRYDKEKILETIHGFPGLLCLLPPKICQTWASVAAATPSLAGVSATQIGKISDFWGKLFNSVDTERMIYVAGHASSTPENYKGTKFKTTHKGDGTVTWGSGELPGVQMYYTDANHGNLPRHRSAFRAYLQLLRDGVTKSSEVSLERPRRSLLSYFRDGSNAQRQNSPQFLQERALRFPQLSDYLDAALGVTSRYDGDASSSVEKVKVQVAHGDLAYATHPIILGHYEEQPLEGSEMALDRRLNGQLSRDRSLAVYPGALNSSRQYLANEDGSRRFQGGVVVGLGEFGQLTPGALTRTVNQAVLDFMLTRANNGSDSGNALSFVSIGSMEGGLTLSESLGCILAAVQQANLAVSVLDGGPRPITEIQFVELFEYRAIETAHIAQSLCSLTQYRETFECVPTLSKITGGLRRVGGDRGRTDWQRLDISRERESEESSFTTRLKFKMLTKDAHNQEVPLVLENAFVETFIQQTSQECKWDPELSHTLFELLVPLRLKEFADDGRHLLLLLTEQTAKYPWEMLMDGLSQEQEPMCVRGSMIRQLSSESGKPRKRASLTKTALLVADPPSNLPELRGAQEEVRLVMENLAGHHFEVECLMRPQGHSVVTKLFAKPYRILHLSGHGTYSDLGEGSPRAGMVLGEGLLLTSSILAQIRVCPELVFINCCHLGRLDEVETGFPTLAANLATEMIRAGAKAVVAAGWAVEDNAAQLFATTFYNQMLAGRTFGKAVLEARRATFKHFTDYNTWGAYQAYGDPDYTLSTRINDFETRIEEEFISPIEAVVELENLGAIAEVSPLEDFERLPARMENIMSRMPKNWYSGNQVEPGVILAIARAYERIIHPLYGFTNFEKERSFGAAIKFYRLAGEHSVPTINDLNFKLRLELLETLYSDSPDFNKVKEIVNTRERLLEQSDNWKSRSRVGGAAMTALSVDWPDEKQVKYLLTTMREWYRKAQEKPPKGNRREYLRDYEFLTRLCEDWSIGSGGLPDLELSGSNFFDVLAGARRKLILWVADGGSDKDFQGVEDALKASWAIGAAPFDFKAVLELLQFLIVRRRRASDEHDALLASLRRLKGTVLKALGWDGDLES